MPTNQFALDHTRTGDGGVNGWPNIIMDSHQHQQTSRLPSSKYKGVVPQPNGRWGAQIYESQHRIWLGTFETEEDAARSYDCAAVRFRGRDAAVNFKEEDDDEENDEYSSNGNGNGNGEQGDLEEEGEKEPMFEKPLTPSDVGKLNRLVIPKQYAERYFPLDSESGEKGLQLSFEDESGKTWRFRYSYWNSSQSYVLTKGWSKFVKEKKLDAGDVVLFQRRRPGGGRLYIGWRRRNVAAVQDSGGVQDMAVAMAAVPWGPMFYPLQGGYPVHHAGQVVYIEQHDGLLHAGEPLIQNPIIPANSKRVRLFGVNLDCPMNEPEPQIHPGSCLPSQGQTHPLFFAGSSSQP